MCQETPPNKNIEPDVESGSVINNGLSKKIPEQEWRIILSEEVEENFIICPCCSCRFRY